MRQRLVKEKFAELQAIYTTRVEQLIQTIERIDHLRKCIQSLCVLSTRKKSVLAHFHILEEVVSELDEREDQEQEELEGVRELALEILSLDRSDAIRRGIDVDLCVLLCGRELDCRKGKRSNFKTK
ncbi:hypothetical protein ACEPAG_2499 [Sanghuangporus baumii]